jgi:hypothetical protein
MVGDAELRTVVCDQRHTLVALTAGHAAGCARLEAIRPGRNQNPHPQA